MKGKNLNLCVKLFYERSGIENEFWRKRNSNRVTKMKVRGQHTPLKVVDRLLLILFAISSGYPVFASLRVIHQCLHWREKGRESTGIRLGFN